MISQLNYSYPDEFKTLIKRIQNKNKNVDLCELDGIGKQLDVNAFSKKFFSKATSTTADVSVDANANIEDVTVIQYISEIAKPVHRMNAYFLLWKYAKELYSTEFAEKAVTAQLMKDIYINDFHMYGAVAYCFNFSCMDVICQGLPFVRKVKSEPPKHLSSFMGQMIQFITYAGNSLAGASAVGDILIGAAYFVEKLRKENPDVPKKFLDKQIKQEIQAYIYSVNQPFRGGIQSVFTNVSVYDKAFLEKLCAEYIFPDGGKVAVASVQEVQEIYIDLMNDTLNTSPVTFPVTTACFAVNDKNEVLDPEFLKFIAKKNLKYGFMNIYAGKTSTLSSCCRLRNDSSDSEYFNSFGAGGAKIGSMGVVTINLPRLAFTSKDREDFLEKVQEYTELAAKINNVKRYILKKRIEGNHYPLYTLGFMNLKKQYSTTGLIGVNEACEILKLDIMTKEGQQLVLDTLDIINKVNSIQEKKFRYPHNVEQIPGESVAVKLAEADRLLGFNKKYELYSNQFIPLLHEADFLDRIKLQGLFDKHMTGGAIAHLNFSDAITDVKFMENLIKTAIQHGVIYHAVNYNLQQCSNGHISVGKNKICPTCSKEIVANFTRVVGFLVNTKNFNKVRREVDYPQRQWYKAGSVDLLKEPKA